MNSRGQNSDFIKIKLVNHTYLEHLNTINGVSFTNREIDITACIISGHSAKKMASFFRISPKTVANHIRNIMIKLGCTSQEKIIDFVEKSGKFMLIKKHYTELLIKEKFQEELAKVSKLVTGISPTCLITFQASQKNNLPFVGQLEKHLNMSGIQATLELQETCWSTYFAQKINFHNNNYIICIFSVECMQHLQENDWSNILKALQDINANRKISNSLILILPSLKELPVFFHELCSNHYINVADHESYYFLVLKILQNLLPGIPINKTTLDFKKYYETLENITISKTIPENNVMAFKMSIKNILISILKHKNFTINISIIFCTIFLYFYYLTINGKNNQYNINTSLPTNDILQNATEYKSKPTDKVDNTNSIPAVANPIRREKLTELRDSTKHLSNGIVYIAITGFAGTGKTVLAQSYAQGYMQQQTKKTIWYIRAEKESTRLEDYKGLAKHLGVRLNNDTKIRDITTEIGQSLLDRPGFVLVFDNVSDYQNISAYLPSNQGLKGQIVITSRKSDILPASYKLGGTTISLNSGMSKKEALELLNKTSGIKTDVHAEELAKRLGYLPLVLVQAGTYISKVHLSYMEYLNLYEKENKKLLEKELPHPYTEKQKAKKTYSAVLRLSINHLSIKAQEILHLCAYLHPDRIPAHLFDSLPIDSNLILAELESRSLINYENSNQYFSVHRVIQDISKALIQEKNLIQNYEQSCIDKVLDLIHIEHRAGIATEHDYYNKLFLRPHLQAIFAGKNPQDFTLAMVQGYLDLALLDKAIGKADIAKTIYEAIIPKVSNRQDTLAAEVYKGLGRSYQGLGEFNKALQHYEQAYKIYQLYPLTANTAEILNDLGMVYHDLGNEQHDNKQSKVDFIKALDFLTRAVNLTNSIPKQNKNRVRYLSNLGELQRQLKDLDTATKTIQAAINIGQKEFLNEKHRLMASAYFNLGNLYLDKCDYQKARSCFEKAVAIGSDEMVCGKKHPLVARHTDALGLAWRAIGDESQACHYFTEAQAILESNKVGQPQLRSQIRGHVESCSNKNTFKP